MGTPDTAVAICTTLACNWSSVYECSTLEVATPALK
jgi:hypothetical protein